MDGFGRSRPHPSNLLSPFLLTPKGKNEHLLKQASLLGWYGHFVEKQAALLGWFGHFIERPSKL
jgi:hypothetical protein